MKDPYVLEFTGIKQNDRFLEKDLETALIDKLRQFLLEQGDPKDWAAGDIANQCLSAATSCLYGVTEAAVLAAGYAPAIGFLHSGKPLSLRDLGSKLEL